MLHVVAETGHRAAHMAERAEGLLRERDLSTGYRTERDGTFTRDSQKLRTENGSTCTKTAADALADRPHRQSDAFHEKGARASGGRLGGGRCAGPAAAPRPAPCPRTALDRGYGQKYRRAPRRLVHLLLRNANGLHWGRPKTPVKLSDRARGIVPTPRYRLHRSA
eukprot:2056831-Prymnesium_polylepis.2